MNSKNNIELPDELKKSPFSVPPAYFDMLAERIVARCDEQKKGQKISLWKRYSPIVAFAAGFLLLIGIAKISMNAVETIAPETRNYLSNNDAEKDVQPILSAEDMSEEMENEIIAYLVDEQATLIVFDDYEE